VRHYECDLYKHVNNAVYLRYIQETALEAGSIAGFSPARCEALGVRWWCIQTDLEYLIPLHYDDRVEVKIWPVAYQAGILWQKVELQREPGGELAARAITGSAFQTIASGAATEPPGEWMDTLFSEGGSVAAESPTQPAPFPPPPEGTFKMRRQVDWQDTNAGGELDHAMLLTYLEECGRKVIAAHNWPMERMLAEGFAILLRRNQVEYLQPARYGDELEMATYASNLKRATATRHYLVRRLSDGALLARMHSLGVWVNLATGLPIRVPPELIKDFAPNIVE